MLIGFTSMTCPKTAYNESHYTTDVIQAYEYDLGQISRTIPESAGFWHDHALLSILNRSQRSPIAFLTKKNGEPAALSHLYFRTYQKFRFIFEEAYLRAGPVILDNASEIEQKLAITINIQEVLNWIKKEKVAILSINAETYWKDQLDSILNTMGFEKDDFCTFVVDLPQSNENLIASYSRLARRKIKLAQANGVVIEQCNDESYLPFLGNLWKETWKRSGQNFDSSQYEDEILKLIQNGYARMFVAKYQNEIIAFRLYLKDERARTALDYSAPSDNLAYEVGANYLLVYFCMLDALSLGMQRYDFFGFNCSAKDGSKDSGIRFFKQQFLPTGYPGPIPTHRYRYYNNRILWFIKKIVLSLPWIRIHNSR